MSEPCISKIAHNYNCFYMIRKKNFNYMEQLQVIQSKIYEIRGQKVMLDRDLAEMYDVQTKVLNQAVKRNIERFPEDRLPLLQVPEHFHVYLLAKIKKKGLFC